MALTIAGSWQFARGGGLARLWRKDFLNTDLVKIARATGRSRTSFYKNTSREFATVLDMLRALNVQLVPVPAGKLRKPRARADVVIAGSKFAAMSHHVGSMGMKARKKK